MSVSTHTSSIKTIIDYLKKSLSAEIYIIGFAIENTDFGYGISDSVKQLTGEFLAKFDEILL